MTQSHKQSERHLQSGEALHFLPGHSRSLFKPIGKETLESIGKLDSHDLQN